MPDWYSAAIGAVGGIVVAGISAIAAIKARETDKDAAIITGFQALFEAQDRRIQELTRTVGNLSRTVDDLNAHIDDLTDTLRQNGITPPPKRRSPSASAN